MIDGYEFKDFSPKIHLRDSVHTTKAGGKLYASQLMKYLINYYNKSISSQVNSNSNCPSFFIPESQRPTIDNRLFDSGDYIKAKQLHIIYELDGSCFQEPYLLASLFIGPESMSLI